MNWLHLSDIKALHALWAALAVALLFAYGAWRRHQALRRFAEAGVMPNLGKNVNKPLRRLKNVLVVLAVLSLVFALARPGWNPETREVKRTGRDVVFLLDLSRSMMAEDLTPNRLERAKIAMADAVEGMEGDRVGLVAFAGTAVVKCPLTLDYGFFLTMLDDLSPDSISRGGTAMGDAIRVALDDVFKDQQKQYKDLILITDGEDHESFPLQAAEEAGERGIRLLAIGLGDEREGSRIPVYGPQGEKRFLTYEGQEVWTRLDADTLRKMVNATPGGRYLNVATGDIDLKQVYQQLVASAEQKELQATTVERYEEKFQIFLGLAFALLLVEALLTDRRRIHA